MILKYFGYDQLSKTKTNWFVTHIQKINFILQHILDMLDFQKSCNLISWKLIFDSNSRPRTLNDM